MRVAEQAASAACEGRQFDRFLKGYSCRTLCFYMMVFAWILLDSGTVLTHSDNTQRMRDYKNGLEISHAHAGETQ